MPPKRRDDLRGALVRHLETDRLIGVPNAPLRIPVAPAPAPARTRPTATAPRPRPPAPAPARTRSPAAARPQPPAPAPAGRDVPKTQQLPAEEIARRQEALRLLDETKVKTCTRCGLCETRNKTVFGQGSPAARLVFVGEAPGADEDRQGLAFVGKAGQLLTKMIDAMGLTRDEVFICNILKCRPPENRDPAPDEISNCWPYLDEQLRTIAPELIVALGRPAAQTLLRTTEGIGGLRGRWHDYFTSGSPMIGAATPLMPTYHPAYLLRSPNEKGKAWNDLKMVMERLGLPILKR